MNNTSNDLPAYLGPATLDPESITYNNGTVTANYLLDEELIYQVTLCNDDCLLTEFFEGQKVVETRHSDSRKGIHAGTALCECHHAPLKSTKQLRNMLPPNRVEKHCSTKALGACSPDVHWLRRFRVECKHCGGPVALNGG